MRELLRQTLPELADRPLEDKRICWCADSADTNYIIDYVPGSENLIVISGDSAHGFKMFPIFGRWVQQLLEDRYQVHERWRWKDVELKGTEGVSWRVGTRKDLRDMQQERKLYSRL